MLDTDIAIHLRDENGPVLDRIGELREKPVLSAITRVELEGGVYKIAALTKLRRERVDLLCQEMRVLPFDEKAATAYGEIVAAIGYSRGKVADRMIAAHARSIGATLVTMNGRDFRDIPGLRLEIWSSPA